MIPTVPVARPATLTLSPAGATLGLTPRLTTAGAEAQYTDFFNQFNAALTRLDDSIGRGGYGCPPTRQCAAETFLLSAQAVRDALHRTVYGVPYGLRR